MEQILNDELYHYGVKGMRWGVRKRDYASEQLDVNKRKLSKYKNKLDKAKEKGNSKKIREYKERIKYLKDDSKFIKNNKDKYNEIYDSFAIKKRRDKAFSLASSAATTAAFGMGASYLAPIMFAKGVKYLSDNPGVRTKVLKALSSAAVKEVEALGIDESLIPIEDITRMIVKSYVNK